jgi:cobalamin-dependent methionine synthase I
MLIVGERINSTRQSIQDAIKARNAGFIADEAARQIAFGAEFVDINCAVTDGDEVQDIDWVVNVIQSQIPDVSICIDSPNYLAIERALEAYKANGSIMINSITAESERRSSSKLIALTMDDKGMPNTAQERFEIARSITDRVKSEGFDLSNLYFDPLIRPISTEPEQAGEFLKSIPLIKSLGVNTICGLSNVSFGLPNRKLINSVFLAMAIHSGLDAAILDPTDRLMRSSFTAAEALVGRDEYCAAYITAFRDGKLI